MHIGIVGGGWYGCHLALSLKKKGHTVIIFEKNPEILNQISGNFGVRLHTGPHTPRSEKSREISKRNYHQFLERYPDLVVEHDYSIYALGDRDANNLPSKVSYEHFKAVCEENQGSVEIAPETMGYKDLISAWSVNEPSVAVGQRLRQKFTQYLNEEEIEVICNFSVAKIDESSPSMSILGQDGQIFSDFDYVINATSYQSLANEKQINPFDIELVYQPCLAMIYTDTQASSKPFSFIVMDGWFPCIMPYPENDDDVDGSLKSGRKYILTHGKWTIMGSFDKPKEAYELLGRIDDQFIDESVRPPASAEMNRFWPEFEKRFKYVGWKGAVLAKIKTEREFRSAVTFKKDRVIQIIPGKVSNVFDVEQEVFQLINQENVLSKDGFQYVKGGVLEEAFDELTEIPHPEMQSTCNLQTYQELTQHLPVEEEIFSTAQALENHSKALKANENDTPHTQEVTILSLTEPVQPFSYFSSFFSLWSSAPSSLIDSKIPCSPKLTSH